MVLGGVQGGAAEARLRGGVTPPDAERLVAESGERAVKALDVCNAVRDHDGVPRLASSATRPAGTPLPRCCTGLPEPPP